jgi:predicted transposase YdaD
MLRHHARINSVSIARDERREEKRSIALNFLRDGFSVEAVSHGTGLSIEEVQQLQQQITEAAQS